MGFQLVLVSPLLCASQEICQHCVSQCDAVLQIFALHWEISSIEFIADDIS